MNYNQYKRIGIGKLGDWTGVATGDIAVSERRKVLLNSIHPGVARQGKNFLPGKSGGPLLEALLFRQRKHAESVEEAERGRTG